MLELAGVPAADGDHAAVDVQLADDGHAPFELRTEGLGGAAAQTQQANQDVLLRVLVGEEGLPAPVSHVVPPHQLHLNTQSSWLVREGRFGTKTHLQVKGISLEKYCIDLSL